MASKGFTHKTAENAKPKEKAYKLSIGRGFYLMLLHPVKRSEDTNIGRIIRGIS